MILSLFAYAKDYPSRNITNIITWSAGGGTDVINRLIMGEMAPILGVNINSINVTGGVGGSNGLVDTIARPADGYALVGLSESNVTASVLGGWENTMDVFDYYIVGGSPIILSVSKNSHINNIASLIEYMKNNEGKIKAGAGGAGSIHHLNLLAFEKGTQTKFTFVPYGGSSESVNAILTGEVDVLFASLAEQHQLIEAKDVIALAALSDEGQKVGNHIIASIFNNYPTLKDHLPLSQSIGFAIRKEAPNDVKVTIARAFQQAMNSEKLEQFLNNNFYQKSGKFGKEAKEIILNLEAEFAQTLWDLGMAKVDPKTLNIGQ